MGETNKPAASLSEIAEECGERGALLILTEPGAAAGARALLAAGERAGLDTFDVDASAASLTYAGVARACAPDFLGGDGGVGPDDAFRADALGEARGAELAWDELSAAWSGGEVGDEDPEGRRLRSSEVLARLLLAVGDVAPRLVHLRRPDRIDGPSLRALRALFAGSDAAGWIVILDQPSDDGPAATLARDVGEAAEDDRLPAPRFRRVTGEEIVAEVGAAEADDAGAADALDDADADAGSLPSRGSAVELLTILGASPLPLPPAVVGTPALSEYRGRAPRGGWQDLQGLIDARAAVVQGGLLSLRRPASRDADGALVRAADAGALRRAVAQTLAPGAPLRARLTAILAAEAGDSDAAKAAADAGRDALERGDALSARDLLDGVPGGGPELSLLRARAARLLGEHDSARRLAESAVGASDARTAAEGGLELALAHAAVGRLTEAKKQLQATATDAQEAELPDVEGRARLELGRLEEEGGEHVTAAKVFGDAAKAFERLGDEVHAARAFAHRAVAMAKAGAPERAVKELRHAMDRAPDLDDPRVAALDVRILVGLVFRDAGSREKARQALGLAADKAHDHVAPEQEARARLMAARFHLEAIPVRGPERGEALRDGREAAEAAILIARGAGLTSLEAEGEGVLGELSWRAEDWQGAAGSLGRQATLWRRAGRPDREVDVAIRRGRLAGRQGAWDVAFKAGVEALVLASKRRLLEQSAQAQLLRGEALENLDRGSEALEAFTEAQRIFTSMGDSFKAQSAAAEQRARQAIARSREKSAP